MTPIMSKKKDWYLLLFLPFIFLLLAGLYKLSGAVPHTSEAIFFVLVIRLVIDTPHFFMTALPTFSRIKEKGMSLYKVVGVLLVTVLILVSLFYYNFQYLVNFMIIMAHYHMYKQQQGWLDIYNRKNNSKGKYSKFALLSLTIGFMTSFLFTEMPKAIYKFDLVPSSNQIVDLICLTSLIFFIIFSYISLKSKEIALKTPVYWGTFIWFAGVYYLIQSEFFITLAMLTLHPIPYMAFCIDYVKLEKIQKIKQVVGVYTFGFFTGLFGILYLETFEIKVLFLSIVIFFHYNMDAVVWKRKNGFSPV